MLESVLGDLRHAYRSLRSAPAFTGVAVVTLALGIGASTAIFTVLQAVLLAPLPYAEPDRAAMVWSGWVDFDETWVSEPEVLDYRGAEVIEELGAFTYASVIVSGDGRPLRLTAATVEAPVFRILGIEPVAGRFFTDDEDVPGGGNVVVLGHALWKERFGGDADAVGGTILLNQESWEVIGVMPAGARLPLDFADDEEPSFWLPLSLEGREPPPGTDFDGEWQVASVGYFEAMGMRLVEGRLFENADRVGAAPVVVVNRRMAEQYWPTEGALGQRIKLGGPDSQRPWASIVGVVDNVRHNAITEAPNRKFYVAHEQWPEISAGAARRTLYLTVRAEREPLGLVPVLRGTVEALDPGLPVSAVRTYADIRSSALAQPRLVMALLTGFGILALLLAAIGVYGVVAYAVAQRTPEFGVRVALGASAASVVALVLRRGALVSGLGIVLGGTAAAAGTRLLSTMLYGVRALDPASFAAVPLILLVVGGLASLLPALRAARVRPVQALRSE